MQDQLSSILEAAHADIAAANNQHELNQVKSRYVGKQAPLTGLLKQLGKLPNEERRAMGEQINAAKKTVYTLLAEREQHIKSAQMAERLDKERCDTALPGRGQSVGGLHPLTQITNRVIALFTQLGFEIATGPEIESEVYNFDALNIPATHPARAMQDTFYFDAKTVLRTHTSPVQIRAMQAEGVPIRVIAPGRVYRRDSDQTHSPMFHQMEGLMIDHNLNFGQLKSLLQDFFNAFFGRDVQLRFRASYFPFTEPSAEVDIWMPETESWLEVLGCGMVHPNVLQACHVDVEQYNGFAFGMGLDRLTMLAYGITDLRLLFNNDLAFLSQFQGG